MFPTSIKTKQRRQRSMQKMQSIVVLVTATFTLSAAYMPTFSITNNCNFTIWPATLAGAGTPQLPTTGFRLDPLRTMTIPATPSWSGRIWARTSCSFDKSGSGSCLTGDCNGRLQCDGTGATPPASLFEITLGTADDSDFYDVSVVDGYNLPLVAAPTGVTNGSCIATGCLSNINTGCPEELRVSGEGETIACRSACDTFGLDEYCCSGQFANPNTCKPSFYSDLFKRACPKAYSYAFDDGTSTFTCKASAYSIVFCPSTEGIRDPADDSAPLLRKPVEPFSASLPLFYPLLLLLYCFLQYTIFLI